MLLSREDRSSLRECLVSKFSLDELKDIAFDLALSWEEFPHQTRSQFARGLIDSCERMSQLGCLIQQVLKHRHSEALVNLIAKIEPCELREIVQIIFRGFGEQYSENSIKQQIAKLFGVRESEISIIGARSGSIRIVAGIPSQGWQQFLGRTTTAVQPMEGTSVIRFQELSVDERDGWLGGIKKMEYSPKKFFSQNVSIRRLIDSLRRRFPELDLESLEAATSTLLDYIALGLDDGWNLSLTRVDGDSTTLRTLNLQMTDPFLKSSLTLRRQLLEFFSLVELRILAHDVGVDLEPIPGLTKVEIANNLIRIVEESGRLQELISRCSSYRPSVRWLT